MSTKNMTKEMMMTMMMMMTKRMIIAFIVFYSDCFVASCHFLICSTDFGRFVRSFEQND